MTKTSVASTHGAGFRLIFRQSDLNRIGDSTEPIEADLFGPDGILTSGDKRQQIGTLNVGDKLVLALSSDDLNLIETLISKTTSAAMEGKDRIGRLISAPLRVYSSIVTLGDPPNPPMLDRLGRLGDALLTDFGFAPPPPVPPQMTGTPAAYTYFGQFLAHELTLFRVEENAVASGPTLVLDSAIDLKTIFREPVDFPRKLPPHVQEAQGLALGETLGPDGKKEWTSGANDLPRKNSGEALLFEMRNDQNLAVSQMHVAITKFAQNAIKLLQRSDVSEAEHRRIVLRHFQSVVLQDYLVRFVDPKTYADVMGHGRIIVAPSAKGGLPPLFFVPIEFSAAIFRFGHVMRRDSYEPWNTLLPDHSVESALASQLLGITFGGGGLTNGQLLQNWTTDWRFMLGQGGLNSIKAKKIGTEFSRSLFCLPSRLFVASTLDQPCPDDTSGNLNLARRTLVGGAQLGLPSGQSLAAEVEAKLRAAHSPCSIPVLTPKQTEIPRNAVANAIMKEDNPGPQFTHETPLWLYILREATVTGSGDRLGPLAGRIVAETFNAAVEATDSGMIVHGVLQPFAPDPSFRGTSPDKFNLHDLIRLAYAAVA